MSAEARAYLEEIRHRVRRRSRLAEWMTRRHKISRQLADWHVSRMTDAQVAEELERYSRQRSADRMEASA